MRNKVVSYFLVPLVLRLALLGALGGAVVVQSGCNAGTVVADVIRLTPVITNALAIWAAVTGNAAQAANLETKINADSAILQKLDSDYLKAPNSQQVALWPILNNAFIVFEEDASEIFQLVQVSDPLVQAKINLIVMSAQALLAVIETFFPGPPAVVTPANAAADRALTRRFAAHLPKSGTFNLGDFCKSVNSILAVKTGNAAADSAPVTKLHIHNILLRTVTIHLVK